MRSLPYRHRDRASRTGFIPADETTLGLGLVTFPPQLQLYIEGPGGLWDPQHPQGDAAAEEAARARQAPPPPPQQLAAAPAAPAAPPAPPPADVGQAGGDVELGEGLVPAVGSDSEAGVGGWAWQRLASLGSGLAARLGPRKQEATGGGGGLAGSPACSRAAVVAPP
jgi:hypothetical protein